MVAYVWGHKKYEAWWANRNIELLNCFYSVCARGLEIDDGLSLMKI